MQEQAGYGILGQQAPTPPQDWGANSRPHSSTSAELDMSMASLSLVPSPPQQPVGPPPPLGPPPCMPPPPPQIVPGRSHVKDTHSAR